MKKAWIIVFVLICLLGLVGCDPGLKKIDGEELLQNTVKIELFDYENTNPKLYDLNRKKVPSFDFSKATFLAALDESHFEAVIKDISEQRYALFNTVLNEPIGKTMILYQKNGNMVVLYGCVYKNGFKLPRYYGECHVFDENGVFIEKFGRIDSNYVDTLAATYFGNTT